MEPETMPSAAPAPKKRNSIVIVIVILVLVLLGVLAFVYMRFGAPTDQVPEGTASVIRSEEENQKFAAELIERVSELMELPQGEEPTTAFVSDPALLADKPFFKDAKEGYGVLMYPQAQLVILYDPVAHRIINAGTLVVDATGEEFAPNGAEETGAVGE